MTTSSRIVAFGLFSLPLAAAGAAQEWPSKPIAIVTTGSADAAPRIVGEEVARTLGQRFLMDSHPGTIARVSGDRQVFVHFLGLEDEPVSSLGFMRDDDGHYPGLVLVSPDEWVAACAVGWWSSLAG